MIKLIKLIALGFLISFVLSIEFPVKAQTSVNGMADTPWPMYQHDPQHTGRSPFLGPIQQPVELWKIELPDCGGENGGFSIALDGHLLASEGGCLINVDPVTRRVDWINPDGSNSRGIALVADDGSFYYGSGGIFKQVAANGKPIWEAPLDANIVFGSSATFGLDGNLFVVHDGMWSLTPNGIYRWDIPYGAIASHASPAIGLDGTVYAGGTYVDLCAYLPDSSDISWCAEFDESGEDNTAAIASDGTIYYPTTDGPLYAIHPSGDLKWKFTPDEVLIDSGRIPNGIAIASDGSIRFGLNPPEPQTYLYAINADGEFLWKVPFSTNPLTEYHPSILFPLTVDRVGNTYFCPANATCYGVDEEGSILWEKQFPMVDSIDLEPTAGVLLAADGLLYVLDNRQYIHAYADPSLYAALSSATGSLGFKVEVDSNTFTTTLAITSTVAPITYTATIMPEVSWLSLPESGGVTPSSLDLRFEPQAVPEGVYRTTLFVMPFSQFGIWLEIPVTLNVGIQQAFLPNMVKGYNTANRILYESSWFTEYHLASIKQIGKDRTTILEDYISTPFQKIYAPDGRKVAITYFTEDYRRQIVVLDTSSGAKLLELEGPGDIKAPTWSPDSNRLGYIYTYPDTQTADVFVINLDGTGQTRLTTEQLNYSNLFWSPRGDQFAVNVYTTQVYLMNADGTDFHQLITNHRTDSVEGWSPDGRYLLLYDQPSGDVQNELGTYNIENGSYAYLTDHFISPSDWTLNAVWSPDGTKIAFRGYEDDLDYDIIVINPDGSGMINLTYTLDHEDCQPVWSPDSRWIAFASRDNEIYNDPNWDIYVIRADGAQIKQLTTNIQADEKPFWLP